MPNLEKVLLVEDDLDIQIIGRLALETVGGLTLEACSSGQDCIQVAPQFRPDLILLDVMMPGMDGPTTLTALKADPELASIPVVFMTAKVQTHEVESYKSMGAIGVIAKPFDPMTLATQVQSLWNQHHD